MNVKNNQGDIFCDLNYGLSSFYLGPLIKLINQWVDDPIINKNELRGEAQESCLEKRIKNLSIFSKKDEFLESVFSLMTRKAVP